MGSRAREAYTDRSIMRYALVLLCGAALRAQSVDGLLTDSVRHVPIPEVIVTLVCPARYNATTDETGAFHFARVPAGKYRLDIVKAGFLLPPERRGVQVESDMRLAVELDPWSSVEGRVRFPDGRPAPRARVWLSAWPLGSTRDVTADPGGHFVFDEVKPGKYLLRANSSGNDPKPEGEIWVATYFPSVVERDAAEPIRVVSGAMSPTDIRLRSMQARRIRGVVTDPVGRRMKGGIDVSVRPDESESVQTGEDGSFEVVVHDGEFHLTASQQGDDAARRGFATVLVARHDVENVVIRLAIPFSVPIVVEGDVPADRKGRPFPVIAMLTPLEGGPVGRLAGDVLEKVYPGKYHILAMQIGPGMYVESVKLGGLEVFGQAFEIFDGSLPIRIRLASGAPVVHGVVEGGVGAFVMAMNADETVAGDPTRRANADGRGRFAIESLRPGDYYFFAVDRDDPAIQTPEFRRAVLPYAAKVHLEKGAAVAVNLKLAPWPE